mmetsp:Transcript_44412/g.117398  ORF Transcript_44412/g.117398 Transcript_44412/m.117398 type:complete len:257 (-) Transcript_44412:98-868(-)
MKFLMLLLIQSIARCGGVVLQAVIRLELRLELVVKLAVLSKSAPAWAMSSEGGGEVLGLRGDARTQVRDEGVGILDEDVVHQGLIAESLGLERLGVLDDLLEHAHDRAGAGAVLVRVELHRRLLLREHGLAHALYVEVLQAQERLVEDGLRRALIGYDLLELRVLAVAGLARLLNHDLGLGDLDVRVRNLLSDIGQKHLEGHDIRLPVLLALGLNIGLLLRDIELLDPVGLELLLVLRLVLQSADFISPSFMLGTS